MRNSITWAPWVVGAGSLLQGLSLAGESWAGESWAGAGLAVSGALGLGLLTHQLRSPRGQNALLTLSLGGLGMALGSGLEPALAGWALMVLFCLPGCCLHLPSCVSSLTRWCCGAGCVVGMVAGMAVGSSLFTAAGGSATCHSGGSTSVGSHFAMLLGMTAGALTGGELMSWLLRFVPSYLNRRPSRPAHPEVSNPWLT